MSYGLYTYPLMRTLQLIFLLLVTTAALWAQPFSSLAELDSIKQLYRTDEGAGQEQRLRWLERLSRYTLGEKDTSRYFTNLLEAEARRLGSERGLTYAAFVRGLIFLEEANYAAADRHTQQALTLARTHGLDTIVGFSYNSLAEIAQARGDFISARRYYIEADRAKRAINDLKGRSITLYNQFDLALRLDYVDDAERLVDSMAVVYRQRNPDKDPMEDWIWRIVLGRLQIARGNYETAEQHLLQVGEIGRRLGFGDRRSAPLLGRVYFLQGRYAEAQPLLEAGVETFGRVGYEEQLLKYEIYLAQNELRMGSIGRASQRIADVLDRADAQRDLEQSAQAYLTAADVYAAGGRPQEANTALRRHLVLKDSILNRDRQVALLDLEAKYQNELNRAEIQRLEQANRIQALARERQLTLLIGIGTVLLLTLVGVGLLWRANRTISAQSETIREALADKASLLSEMHHRTKNNLTIVQSLLLAQGRELNDPEAVSAIAASSDRILSVGLIHQHLYEHDAGRWVDLPDYLDTLCANLRTSLIAADSIQLTTRVVDRAIPAAKAAYLGLIVNELVTNAVKHAFSENTLRPTVSITIDEPAPGELRLSVEDNGSGLPQAADYRNSLLALLVRQLRAGLQTVSEEGLRVIVSFKTAVATA